MKAVTALLSLLLPAAVLLPRAAAADDSFLSRIPPCAAKCLAAAMAKSTCSITDAACMCTNKQLAEAATACTLASCTTLEAMQTKNLTNIACHLPVRDKSGVFHATTISLGTITGAFVVARFAYRIFIAQTEIGADDWATLIAIVTGIPSTVLDIHGLEANGLGRDVFTLPPADVARFLKFFYINEVMYFIDVPLQKFTILLFYLRIFPAPEVRRVIWGTIAFVGVFGLLFFFIGVFQCSPVSYFWTNWEGTHKGTCLNINAIGWAHAAISIALDFWMLAIPLWQLRKLRLHWKKKVGVSVMFIVGTFVTIVSILRLQSLVSFSNSINPTWDNYEVVNWSVIEVNVGIICACLPTTRLILVHFFPRVLGSSSMRYYADNHYYNSGGPGGTAATNNNAGTNPNASNSRSRGAGRRGRSRSIPLVATEHRYHRHHKGSATTTTVTSVHGRDELDEHDAGLGALGGIGGVLGGASSAGASASAAKAGAGGASGSGAGAGIIYSKSYAVEYGSDYHDEARLVDRRVPSQLDKSDGKSESRGSESSL